jgi:hypothetical protein
MNFQNKVTEHKMCFDFLYNFSLKYLIHSSERDMTKLYTALYVKNRYSSSLPVKLELSQQIFEKHSNIKFHENPSSGS